MRTARTITLPQLISCSPSNVMFFGDFFLFLLVFAKHKQDIVCLLALLPLLAFAVAFDQTFNGGATHTRCIRHVFKPSGYLIEE